MGLPHTFTCCGMPEFWIRVGGLLVLMCGLPYLQACWGMPVKCWEGDPPCIGLGGGGCPWGRIPQDQWLGDTCRFGCWASFSTCICSWASVLCLCCCAWAPVRATKGGPSPLAPGFICWKGNGWGPGGCRAELFSTTREPGAKIFTESLQLLCLKIRITQVTLNSHRSCTNGCHFLWCSYFCKFAICLCRRCSVTAQI